MSDAHPRPPDIQTELAKERNRIAADRSLLSFVRNSLTLIGFGVGVDAIVQTFYAEVGRLNPILWTHILSLIFIGLGTLSLLMAASDYQRELKRLNQPEYHFTPRWSLGAGVGMIVLGVGMLAFVLVMVKAFA